MSDYKEDYIAYRVQKSYEALDDALLLSNERRWNAAMSRLYYSCYYMVSAVLLKYGVTTKTHSGLAGQFGIHFVAKGIVRKDLGKLFTLLFDNRQKGDYGDLFDFSADDVLLLLPMVE